MNSIYYVILLWILFTGCASFKDVERADRAYINQQNMQRLAGIYESMPVSIEETEYFDDPIGAVGSTYQNFLFDRFRLVPAKKYADSASNYLVEIEAVEKDEIILRLLKGSEIVKTKTIRGKYKNGYFYRRNQLVIVPFVPVLFGYRLQRQRIGVEDNMLIVDLREKVWVFFVLAGQYKNSQHEAKYRKIEEQ